MATTRVSYQIGRYVGVEIRDYGHGRVEVVFSQDVYVDRVLTKKEFELTLHRWQQLTWCIGDIEESIKEHTDGKDVHYSYRLGANVHVQVNSGFKVVDIRKFWLPEGRTKVCPTRKGIALKFDEFDALVKLKAEIEQVIPELNEVQPCWMDSDHMNQLGALACPECNPNDYQNW